MIAARDPDYFAARLCGRRAQLAEGKRLEALCALRSPRELGEALFPGAGLGTPVEIEQRLVEQLVEEMWELSVGMSGPRGLLGRWLAMRFPLENLKVALRALASGSPPDVARRLLVRLPAGFKGFGPELLEARTPESLVASLPEGLLRDCLAQAYVEHPERRGAFFHEAELDRCFLQELLARSSRMPREERPVALSLARHDVAAHDLLLAARGRFFHRLEAEDLVRLDVEGSALDLRRFRELLEAPDVASLRALAANIAVDPGPPEPDPAQLAALTNARRARLAQSAFRNGRTGFGVLLGYLALRRTELATLITVSEGLGLSQPMASGEMLRRVTWARGGLA